jgi:hypothetical protein
MSQPAPTDTREYTFAVTIEIDAPAGINRRFQDLSISCQFAIGDRIIEGPPDYYPDDERSREKVHYRVNYILKHLENLARRLWNESNLAAELDAGHLDSSKVQDILRRWGSNLISQDAATRLPELRGRPGKLDRQTENEMDLIYAEELENFANAKTLFEEFEKDLQPGDSRESLLTILGSERFAFAEQGFTSVDIYQRQPSKIALNYLAHHYGMSTRQLERIRSAAKKRRAALKKI